MPRIGFLIIGAPKAGTTSLFEYLRHHPQLHMPAEKEIYFFNVDGVYRNGPDWYIETMLRDASGESVCGEASTEYMRGSPYRESERSFPDEDPGSPVEEIIPLRIKALLPDVKLICMLRDPIARTFSHYLMRKMEKAETRSFDEVVTQLLEPSGMEQAITSPSRTNGYIVNSEYHRSLSAYLRVFSKDQLMTIFSDDLARRPVDALHELFAFLEVSAFTPDNLDTQYRVAATKQRIPGLSLVTWHMQIARLGTARKLWFALPDSLRQRLLRAYNVATYNVELWNARRGTVEESISDEARDRLMAHFLPDSEALAQLLGREVPWLAGWQREFLNSR